MVLGVGGGLGAGYILWEFKAHDLRSLVFGFRNSWQYPDRWARKTCQRLGVPAAVHETGSAGKADAELRAAVGQGVPAIAWADQQALGYRHLPAWLEGRGGPPVTVYAIDDAAGVALIDDRNRAPLTRPAGRPGRGPGPGRLLQAPAAGAGRPGRRAGRRRAPPGGPRRPGRAGRASRAAVRLVLAAGLPQVGPAAHRPPQRQGLADGVRRPGQPVRRLPVGVREPGAVAGSDGGNLRGLYAEFLDEAAGLLDAPALGKAAAAYREAAARWHEVAEIALPAGREPFAEARRLTDQLQAQVERGDAAQQAAAATAASLWALRDRWRPSSPATTRTSRPC